MWGILRRSNNADCSNNKGALDMDISVTVEILKSMKTQLERFGTAPSETVSAYAALDEAYANTLKKLIAKLLTTR
ncbi:MAG: hypothetical protein BWY15_02447 [Firmicutes bacterium ADurb.Bin193]|nr:MAG: hypothetical protein BWY15_02447 [Firmicutes bacterium ADurb.Bin193]